MAIKKSDKHMQHVRYKRQQKEACRCLLLEQAGHWRQYIPAQENPQGHMHITRPVNAEPDRSSLHE